MNRESFLKLSMIHKLEIEIGDHFSRIKSQKDRIKSIENKKSEAELTISESEKRLLTIRATLAKNEKSLFETDNAILKTKEHLTHVTTSTQESAITRELANLIPKKAELEETVFKELEEVDSLETIIKDANSFLKGLAESRLEIEAEVLSIATAEEIHIARLQKNVEEEWKALPASLKNSYTQIKKRHPLSEITYITGGNCHICRIKIGREIETQVERSLALEFCGGCGRILSPHI